MDSYTVLYLMLGLVQLKLLLEQTTQRRKKRPNRRYWVHPTVSRRLTKGHFHTLYHELRRYPQKFYDYAHMRVSTFDALLEILRPRLMRARTNMRLPVSAEERLLVTLRFLATGESFSALHFQFLLGKVTIHTIVHDTCDAIWILLKDLVMPEPTEERWIEIGKDFEKNSNFPHCIGALDSKLIRIQMPPNSSSKFCNYKKYFSVLLMAIADSNYNFVAIDVGTYGSSTDSQVFRNSAMGKRIMDGRFHIPSPRPLEENGDVFPYVIVADDAFSLSTSIMKPYPKRGLDVKRKVFNYRLTRARRFVECTFGILTNKWRVFRGAIQMNPNNIDTIVKSACALHNFVCQKEGGYNFDDSLTHDLEDVSWPSVRSTNEACNVREKFANYFMSPAGELPSQYSKI